MRKVIKILVAVVCAALVAAVVLPLAAMLVASLPAVQNAVAERLTALASERIGARVSVDRVEMRMFNRVRIEGLYVADQKGDTLLYAPMVEAPVVELGLWGEPLTFGRVKLHGARMWIRRDSTGVVNIRQLVRTARLGRTKAPDPNFRMYINGIEADSVTFGILRDEGPERSAGSSRSAVSVGSVVSAVSAGKATGAERVDFGRFVIRNTRVDIDFLAIEGRDIRIGIHSLAFDERTGWRMDDLSARELLISRGSVSLRDVAIASEGSTLSLPRVAISGADWRSFRHFADSVRLDVAVAGSRLGGRFLGRFVPAIPPVSGVTSISGGTTLAADDLWVEDLSAHVSGPLAALDGAVESARVVGLENFSAPSARLGRADELLRNSIVELAAEFTTRGLPDVRTARVEGVVSRLEVRGSRSDAGGGVSGAQPAAWGGVGPGASEEARSDGDPRVGFAGNFAGSMAGVALDGDLSVARIDVGNLLGVNELGFVSGVFDVNAGLGIARFADELRSNSVRRTDRGRLTDVKLDLAGRVGSIELWGRAYSDIEVEGSLEGDRFEANILARDPGRDFGLSGELSARVEGEFGPRETFGKGFGNLTALSGRAELRNAIWVTPRGTVTTPLVALGGRITSVGDDELSAEAREDGGSRIAREGAFEKTLTLVSEFVDAELQISARESNIVATFKNTDRLADVFAGGLRVAEGTTLSAGLNPVTGLVLLARTPRIEYRNFTTDHLTLHARSAGNDGEDHSARVSLDGVNWLTVKGVSPRGVSDTLHVDFERFDVSSLAGVLKLDGEEIFGAPGSPTPDPSRGGSGELLAGSGLGMLLAGVKASGHVDLIRGVVSRSGVRDPAAIDASLGIDSLNAALLDRFSGGALTGTRGRIATELRLRGTPRSPRVDGTITLADLATTIGYTGVRYTVERARVEIENSRATLPSTILKDERGGTGILDGQIDLKNPADVKIRFGAAFENLLAMDIPAGRGDGFWGRAFATGSLEIRAERMGAVLDIVARTDPETRLNLPLGARDNVDWADFVTFREPVRAATPARATTTTTGPTRNGGGRMEMNLSLDVTDDARVNITLDPRLGRGITARGEGSIGLRVNPNEDLFTMTGDYAITDGHFEFSMMDVLSKTFTIAPGSTLRWSGAPTDAMLDLRALYRVRTSLAPLVGEGSALGDGRGSVPVDCVLSISESLAEPEVTFDIEFPSTDTDARLVAAAAMNTPELKSMQFLSLLVTGSFASAGSIAAAATTSSSALAGGAVGFDILTTQLGNLLSSDNWDLYFHYRPQDNFLTNRLDMGFSTGFMRDRLRLEIEGNWVDDRAHTTVGMGGASDLAGDVSLTWDIDRKGNLRLKVFSQTIDRLNETQGLQESGLGVYWKKDFERFGRQGPRRLRKNPKKSVNLPPKE